MCHVGFPSMPRNTLRHVNRIKTKELCFTKVPFDNEESHSYEKRTLLFAMNVRTTSISIDAVTSAHQYRIEHLFAVSSHETCLLGIFQI